MIEPPTGKSDLARIVDIAVHLANRPADTLSDWLKSADHAAAQSIFLHASNLNDNLVALEKDLEVRAMRWRALNSNRAPRMEELLNGLRSLLLSAETLSLSESFASIRN